jgi:hypothetical protein
MISPVPDREIHSQKSMKLAVLNPRGNDPEQHFPDARARPMKAFIRR